MNAIELHGVSKTYRLGAREQGYATLRETLGSLLRTRSNTSGAELWALRDIDVEIPERQVVGIIGGNGAGKSTLLKLITGIAAPTAGIVRTRGRVGALLEVGTGFHPELTGRENVFLNASVLGMPRRAVRRHFEEIVAFAGVERFIDTPLKRYSTGMRLRLAFAVAAHIKPPIIVVDEVLAVADAEFQRRCLGKMAELGTDNRTVLFVSHDLGAVAQLCRRVLWINAGMVMADGSPGPVIEQYLASSAAATTEVDLTGSVSGPIALLSAAVVDDNGTTRSAPRRDEALRISVRFEVRELLRGLDIALQVRDRQGAQMLDDAWSDASGGVPPRDLRPGTYSATVEIPPVLATGTYVVGAYFGTPYEDLVTRDILRVEIRARPDDRQEYIERRRSVHIPVTWKIDPIAAPTSRPEARL